jgi:phosphomethylpyrimidine synthase
MKLIDIGNNSRGRTKMRCGEGAPTLIIASVGTSSTGDPVSVEVRKSIRAAELGAHVVTDHSFYGDINELQRAIAADADVGLSTVACYEFAAKYQKREWRKVSPQTPIDLLQAQIERGVDLVTIHASLLRSDVANVDQNDRLIPTTSKGGGIVANYIRMTGRENPYYEYFDDVLRILAGTGAAISLGTTFRTATVCDTWDKLLLGETRNMGELVRRAIEAKVPIMVEGFGHAAINSIPTYIRLAKLYCADAPYRVLPMATDRALGFDHISGAIAAAVAVANGANAVTAMSRAEHIGLPDMADMEEAIIATKIAAACGELGTIADFDPERQMSRTRWAQGCKGDWTVAIHPAGAEEALERRGRLNDQLIQCSMCGDFCGINAGIATVKLGPTRLRDD